MEWLFQHSSKYCVLLQGGEQRETLEEPHYGSLRPSEQRIIPGSRLRRAVDTITRREEQLELLLDEAGQKILSEMSDAQQTADHITALENFILGFRPGI